MRTFVAVEITDVKILEKIQKFQQEFQINAKPIKINQIHFTLQFLGEISEEKCEEVKQQLKKITFSQFNLSSPGRVTFTTVGFAHKFSKIILILKTKILRNFFIF